MRGQRVVIRWFRKRQKIENKEWDQYKEAVRTLNKELTTKLAEDGDGVG